MTDAMERALRVKVPDRDEVGVVLQQGKNLGTNPSVYCYVIYFPSTGECCFYDATRVTRIES